MGNDERTESSSIPRLPNPLCLYYTKWVGQAEISQQQPCVITQKFWVLNEQCQHLHGLHQQKNISVWADWLRRVTRSVRAVRDTPVADYSAPGVNTRVELHIALHRRSFALSAST